MSPTHGPAAGPIHKHNSQHINSDTFKTNTTRVITTKPSATMCRIVYSDILFAGCGCTVPRSPGFIPCSQKGQPDHPVTESYLASKKMHGTCGRPECEAKEAKEAESAGQSESKDKK